MGMRIKDLAVRKARQAIKAVMPTAIEHDELRPATFDQFIGQTQAVAQLRLMCEAAKLRGEPVDHLIMTGPGGLGKTTLALMTANAMQAPLFVTTAVTLGPETLGKVLSTAKRNLVLFVDEFHGLSKRTSELLYAAMEDGVIDVPTPAGPQRRQVKPFTLIAATTNPGHLTESMRDRFGHEVELTYYSDDEMTRIVERSAEALGLVMDTQAAGDIAERSRGIPRVANQYVKRVRDWSQVKGYDKIGVMVTEACFDFFGVDALGLTDRDRQYLTILCDPEGFRGGPVGEQNLAIRLGMDGRTVQNEIEPYLLRIGLVIRAKRGRIATEDGRAYARELAGDAD